MWVWQIRRYESCLLSALDSRGNGLHVNAIAKRPCGEANHKHAHVPAAKSSPAEALRGGSSNKSSSRQGGTEEGGDDLASVSVDNGEQPKAPNTSKFFSEQAKLLSDLFTHPWKVADCVVKDDGSSNSRHQMGPKYADWR